MYSFIVILNNSLNLHDWDNHINKPVSCSQLQTFKPSSARLPPVFLTSLYKAPLSFIPLQSTCPIQKFISTQKTFIHLLFHKNIYPSLSAQTYNFRKIYKIHDIRIQKCKKHTHDIKCRIKPIHLFSP